MLKPQNGKLLIKQHKKEHESGLIIAGDAEESLRMPKGEILAVSDDLQGYTPGEIVYFNEFAGERIKYNNEELLLVPSNLILAKEVC